MQTPNAALEYGPVQGSAPAETKARIILCGSGVNPVRKLQTFCKI